MGFEEELYRYEYRIKADPDEKDSDYDSVIYTEFILAESEIDALIQAHQYDGDGVYGVRKATQAEIIAYNAGFENGSMIATARDRMENYNGVTYSLDSIVDALEDGVPISTRKNFRCGGCGAEYGFEDAVMIGKNFLMRLNGQHETPWFVCIKCV
jgi:hypothetical protein